MYNRRSARPRLESMEDRLALSALSVAAPAAVVHSTRLAAIEAHKAHVIAVHAAKHEAAAQHHLVATHAHAPAHKTTGSSTKLTNIFQQFFKSAFGGL